MTMLHPRWMFAVLAAWACLLPACGGGGGGAGPAEAPQPIASAPAAGDARLAAVSALAEAYRALQPGAPEADAQALLEVLGRIPGIEQPEITQPGVLAYRFADGSPAVLDLRRRFDDIAQVPVAQGSAAPADATRRQALAVRLPVGRRAFLFDALADGLGDTSWATISGIKAWLARAGYVVDATAFTTPTGLRGVQAADVLYIDGHGGIGRYSRFGSERFYAVATGVPVDDRTLALFREEILAGEVAIYGVPEPFDPASLLRGWRLLHYMAITPRFVKRYFDFRPGALVFINGCEFMMDGPEAESMRAAFRERGATTLLGWDGFTSALLAAESGRYLFDRLLGANGYSVYKTDPQHRPFDLPAVLKAMADNDRKDNLALQGAAKLKLDQSLLYGLIKARLKLSAPDGDALALAPSIGLISLDNSLDRLMLSGRFGARPGGAHSITVGDVDFTNQASWTPTSITINGLPRSGPGSSGRIVVRVESSESNPVWVNAWREVQISNFHPLDGSSGFGDHTARIVTQCTVNFRAAVGSFRVVPESPATLAAINGDPTEPAGNCRYSASGRLVYGLGTQDLSVAGSPEMPWADPATRALREPPPRMAWVSAQMQAQSRTMDVQMVHRISPQDGGGPKVTDTDLQGRVQVFPVTGMHESAASSAVSPVRFDNQGNLLAGGNQQSGNYITWSGAPAAHTEDPQAGR